MIKSDKTKTEGNLALTYLILYSLVRVFTETLRLDSVLYVHGIPIAIIMSGGIIVLSIILMLIRNLPKKEF